MDTVDTLLCYKFGKIGTVNLNDPRMDIVLKLPFSWKYDILSGSKLLARLLRLDARYGIQIESDRFIVVRDKMFYEIDIQTKNISQGFQLPRGNRPLNIVSIDVEGFDKALYFGEYFGNPELGRVRVYKRIACDKWVSVYEFPSGEIRHVHNIISDNRNKCVWILTGDWGKSAAIWRTTNNFTKVEAVCRGDERFRSCVAFPYNEGLLYATDSPTQKNALYRLYNKDGKWEIATVAEINGSVIYGSTTADALIFSTVVEPNDNIKVNVGMGGDGYEC
jgi:hypothetical protein